jgi:hypothetical protein
VSAVGVTLTAGPSWCELVVCRSARAAVFTCGSLVVIDLVRVVSKEITLMDAEWRYSSFAGAVFEFVPEALDCLRDIYGKPHFGRVRYSIRSWIRRKTNSEELQAQLIEPTWLTQYGYLAWKGTNKICELASFQKVFQVVESDDQLRRRIYATHSVLLEQVRIEEGNYLSQFLQDTILSPMVSGSRSFDLNSELLDILYRDVELGLASPVITHQIYVPLANVSCPEEIELSPRVSLRRLSDDELSDGIWTGAIMGRPNSA